MRTLHDWFFEYGQAHQHPTNRLLHEVCVPTITFSALGLLAALPAGPLRALAPEVLAPWVSWAVPVTLGVLGWYLRLSPRLALLAVPAALLLHLPLGALWTWGGAGGLAGVCGALFVAGWVGQLYGHTLEGARPSFLKDLAFLLIGPAWVLDLAARGLGLRGLTAGTPGA